MKRLSFFSYLNAYQFFKIVKLGSYCWFPKNSIIISEKSISQYVYVLIAGSVTFFSQNKAEENKVEHGSMFGEIVLIEKEQVQAISKYTYRAEQDCQLLKFDWEKCKEIILNPARDEFIRKIKVLRSCQYIKTINSFAAVLLSLLGTVDTYGYGEIIIKQNTKPKYFSIILEGECKCIYEKIIVRSQEIKSVSPKICFGGSLKPFQNLKKESPLISFYGKRVKNLISTNIAKIPETPSGRSFENQKLKIAKMQNSQQILYLGHVNK